MTRLPLALLAVISAAAPASAQAPVAGLMEGRYQMQAVEGGIARLDTATGEISFCRVEGGAIACEGAPDDGTEMQRQLDSLSARLDRLEAGSSRSGGGAAEELEDAAEQMRFFFRTFRDIMREMDEEFGEENAEPGELKLPIRG